MSIIKQPLSLQDDFLQALTKQKLFVAIYLSNGIKLRGIIEAFDENIILLRSSTIYANQSNYTDIHKKMPEKSATDFTQMIYKHTISTVLPLKPFAPDSNNENE